jgi:hypothetical protein
MLARLAAFLMGLVFLLSVIGMVWESWVGR